MGIQLQMEQMSGYFAARFIGSGAPKEIWRQFELIAEHCKMRAEVALSRSVTAPARLQNRA